MKYSECLCKLRNAKGLTQKEAASIFEISTYGYQRYEYGEREPSISLATKIAEYYHVSLDYMLGRTDNPQISFHDNEALLTDGLNPSVARLQGKILTIDSQTADELENYLEYLNFKKANNLSE